MRQNPKLDLGIVRVNEGSAIPRHEKSAHTASKLRADGDVLQVRLAGGNIPQSAAFRAEVCGKQRGAFFVKNFDEGVLEHALCVECFGGELVPEKQSAGAKLVLKMMLKAAKGDPKFRVSNEIFPDRITDFAAELQR